MKTTLYILAFTFLSTLALAGPKDKNYKPWKDKSPKAKLYNKQKAEKLQGPSVKNEKVWNESYTTEKLADKPANKLKGPKFKNQKH